MRLLKKIRKGDAVYWPPLGEDQFGKTVFGPPVALKVRWEDTQEVVLAANGDEVTSSAKVFVGEDLTPVDQKFGVLWKGKISDCQPDDPFKNENARVIVRFDKIPTIDYKDFLRLAYL